MSKIVYILGAGASYGLRMRFPFGSDENSAIKRGVPIVSEIPDCISLLLGDIDGGTFESNEPYKASNPEKEEIKKLLSWLKDICDQFPTIDTYAKLLYVTHNITEYKQLKNALALFFTLVQDPKKRDLRYDGFLASLINKNAEFPDDITILSWNYDYQMEFAFSNYFHDEYRSIGNIWQKLNLFDKTQSNLYSKDSFSVIKLNGTASFIGEGKTIVDMYFRNNTQSILSKLGTLLADEGKNASTDLSFAWEDNNPFLTSVKEKIQDAEVVVVIGYSYPYFNREVDRVIIQSMADLKKIYIQDPVAKEIKESFEATLSSDQLTKQNDGALTYVLRQNLSQFVIPNELE
jgi:hypothetical protein